MGHVPRHEFIPDSVLNEAYEDHPLPIGENQTISQPYIVAVMLQALALHTGDCVLEVGTGSGYVTALLAEIVAHVYSIERHASLAKGAEDVLKRLGYGNTSIRLGDGTQGWSEAAPFDVVIVSAAATDIPQILFSQLKEGGRMIIPVGASTTQDLLLVQKHEDAPVVRKLDACRFVPLVEG